MSLHSAVSTVCSRNWHTTAPGTSSDALVTVTGDSRPHGMARSRYNWPTLSSILPPITRSWWKVTRKFGRSLVSVWILSLSCTVCVCVHMKCTCIHWVCQNRSGFKSVHLVQQITPQLCYRWTISINEFRSSRHCYGSRRPVIPEEERGRNRIYSTEIKKISNLLYYNQVHFKQKYAYNTHNTFHIKLYIRNIFEKKKLLM